MVTQQAWIVCDVDGTVSDWRKRLPFLDKETGPFADRNSKERWEQFYAQQSLDPPFPVMAALIAQLLERPYFKVTFATGRPERYRQETTEWLNANVLTLTAPMADYAPTYSLNMRAPGLDHLSNAQIKEQWLSGEQSPYLAIDDNDECLAMYRRHEITTIDAKKYQLSM